MFTYPPSLQKYPQTQVTPRVPAAPRHHRGPHLVEPDNVGVAQHLHNLHFPENLLQVLFIQLRLINDLDSNLTTEKENSLTMHY